MGDRWERLILLIRIALIPLRTDIVNEGDKFCTLRQKRQNNTQKNTPTWAKYIINKNTPTCQKKKYKWSNPSSDDDSDQKRVWTAHLHVVIL